MNSSSELQDLIDSSHGNVVDCQWQAYQAMQIVVHPGNSEAILENVIIELLPFAKIGNICVVQNRSLWGVTYPAGDVNFTIRNAIIRGGFTGQTGEQQHTEALADSQGWGANAITTVTNKCGCLTLENVTFENCGNSAVAGMWDRVVLNNVRFVNVAKHCVGLTETGATQVEIADMECIDCGNAIDFSGKSGRLAGADTAIVDRLTVRNAYGRAKCAGGNWHIVGKDWSFINDSVVNFNVYAAFELTRNPRHFEVDGFTSVNFATAGLASNSDTTTGGTINVNRAFITNSLSGMKIQQAFQSVDNSVFTGCHHRYRPVGVPQSQTNNDDQMIGSDQQWGQVMDEINYLYDSKGWARPGFWVPNSLLPHMETR